MTPTRRHVLVAVSAAAATAVALPAQAANLDIKAFYGKWRGTAMSESMVSLTTPSAERDIDVQIAPAATPGAFTVAWTTVQYPGRNSTKTEPTRRQTTLTFVPSGAVYRASEATDPMSPQGYAWARIKGQTLTVTVVAVDADGAWEVQSYKRTLSGTGMGLNFTARRDGTKTRTVKGRLVRDA